MNLQPTSTPAPDIEADAVVVAVLKQGDEGVSLTDSAAAIDAATGGILQRLIAAKEVTGKANELTTLLSPTGVKSLRVVVVGLGEQDKLNARAAFRAAAASAKKLAGKKLTSVAVYLGEALPEPLLPVAVSGFVVGCHGQDLYRSERKLQPFEQAAWSHTTPEMLRTGIVLGESVNLTRRLVNEGPSDMNPEALAAETENLGSECELEVEVWDKQKLTDERCGSLLAVARGSAHEPRLVIMRHRGAGENAPTLALVGKGVTFDSGGLSLKPSDSMKTMKCDMAGAATVIGAMRAIALLRLPVNVIGLVGLVENMVSGNSYKLGDVLRTRNGKTIEVLNTDAEGRLVLADVLDVACSEGADKIVDLATLTGACVVALGMDTAGLMTNDQNWCDQVRLAAEDCGEQAWQLPMFPEFGEQIKSDVADIRNIGQGRWGGAMTAAKLLEEFVQEKPWTHIDIAGPSFLDSAKPWIDAGGSGAFVRTLVELARRFGGKE